MAIVNCLAHFRFESSCNDELGNYSSPSIMSYADYTEIEGSFCADMNTRFMDIPFVPLGHTFSFSWWARWYGSGNSARTFIDNTYDGNGFYVEYDGAGYKLELMTTNGVDTSIAISDANTTDKPENGMTHMVVVIDTCVNQVTFYIDNNDEGTRDTVKAGITIDSSIRIGKRWNNSNQCYGFVDDLQIYSGKLKAGMVNYLFTNPGSRVGNISMNTVIATSSRGDGAEASLGWLGAQAGLITYAGDEIELSALYGRDLPG